MFAPGIGGEKETEVVREETQSWKRDPHTTILMQHFFKLKTTTQVEVARSIEATQSHSSTAGQTDFGTLWDTTDSMSMWYQVKHSCHTV